MVSVSACALTITGCADDADAVAGFVDDADAVAGFADDADAFAGFADDADACTPSATVYFSGKMPALLASSCCSALNSLSAMTGSCTSLLNTSHATVCLYPMPTHALQLG
eukprot:1903497-Amphidinium_carterae.1